jgi:hypothetical protein
MSQPLPFPSFLRCRKAGLPEYILAPRSPVATLVPLSTELGTTVQRRLDWLHLRGLNRFAQGIVASVFVQYGEHGSDDREAEYG